MQPTEMAMLARLSSLVRPFAQAAAEAIKRAVHKAPAPAAQRSVRFFDVVVGAIVRGAGMSTGWLGLHVEDADPEPGVPDLLHHQLHVPLRLTCVLPRACDRGSRHRRS